MKLISFRVTKFRNIVDSGEVLVDPLVTSVVGKNEAGKSALLEALYLLNPVHKTNLFLQDQYPRWLLSKDRRSTNLEEHAPISAKLLLEEEDLAALENKYGAGALKSNSASVSRRYDGVLDWTLDCDEVVVVKQLTANLPSPILTKFSAIKSIKDFRGQLKKLKNSALSNDEFDMIASRLDTDADFDESSLHLEDLEKISDSLHEMGLENGNVESGIGSALTELLPQFLLFTQYSTLPGRINLSELAYSSKGEVESPDIQTARSLIRLTGTDLTQLRNEDYELRRSELEAVGIDLTQQVFQHWKQNPNLEVSIDIDKINVQHGDKSVTVPRYMEIRLRDKRTGYSNNFRQRSSGFQWFFSFLAAFSEFDKEDAPILLLDEPAVRLHGKTQRDFLSFIHDELAPSSQVIYSTHSPFMIETKGLNRVRIVEDLGPPEGSVVLSDPRESKTGSAYPLQAAIANAAVQNIFSGEHNLIIESLSDYLYLTTMSDICRENGREALDQQWEITPVGQAIGLALLTNLSDDLPVATLLAGSKNESLQLLSQGLDQLHVDENHLLYPGVASNFEDAEMEDLFTQGDYIKLYNGAFDKRLKANTLGKSGQISEQIETKQKGPLDKLAVAKYLLRNQQAISFTNTSLDRFEALIGKVNEKL